MKEIEAKGIVVFKHQYKKAKREGKPFDLAERFPLYVGQAIGGIDEIKPARDIVLEIVSEAIAAVQASAAMIRHVTNGISGVSSRL